MADSAERIYRTLVTIGVPLRRWARLEADGHDALPPRDAPLLVVANHDSMVDPLAVADTLVRAGRPIRFLAMDRLWDWWITARLLDGMRQIPIRRDAGDADALEAAIEALARGEAICIFPEGRLSRGQHVRARTGVARLIAAEPRAHVVLAAVSGATDLVRFPRRPRVRVELFRPASPPRPGEEHGELAARLLAEIRARVPPAPAGRRV